MKEPIDKYFESIVKNLLPRLPDEEANKKALEIKEGFKKNIISDLLTEYNPFNLLMLLVCGYSGITSDIEKALIKLFKDKTGVEATVEDIKLYNNIDSEIGTYQIIKNYLEKKDTIRNDIPPILSLILSCKATFLISIKEKINELLNKQKEIIKKYE